MSRLNKTIAYMILLAAVPGQSGCSECHVTLRDGNAANAIHSKTAWGSAYIVAEPDPGQFSSAGIHTVVVKDNLLYDVIGVVTLGFFKPCTVEYRNLKPGADDGGDMRPPARAEER